MSKLSVYALGGAGINVGSGWIHNNQSKVLESAQIVGVDFSQNNLPAEQEFEVIHPDVTRGGGSVRSLNADLAPDLIKQVLMSHRPGDFNIIISGSSGGSGSLLLPYLVRDFLENEIPFVVFMIYDKSSLVFMENTVQCLRSLDAQRKKYELPIVFDIIENKPDMSRGEINKLAYQRLDLLSLFLTDEHKESDYQDICHLLQYNKLIDVAPSLTSISYYSDKTIESCTGNPIARFSLFEESEAIRSIDLGAHYVTGVRNPKFPSPEGTSELHLVLEYDAMYDSLIEEMEKLKDNKTSNRTKFERKRKVDVSSDEPEDGMFY